MILYPNMTTQYENIAEWLQEGILAAKAGQVQQARFRLLDVVEQDQTNEAAWFWLYQVFDRPDDKRVCLENLLVINPHNSWARQELLNSGLAGSLPLEPATPAVNGRSASPAARQQSKSATRTGRPLVLKIITAFWVGISFIFLSGGIIASGEWLASTIRSRNFPHYLTAGQTFELAVALLFVVVGLVGLNVALALFLRSMIGFYGSLLLALGLLLVGPTVSLIASPPNYVVMTCTGGMAGMVVLLTLASHPGFKDT